ncbi:MATE family efflux transporter [Pseudaeromonas sharmana]|uniref:MATE family efflux transporter n=1 Tax=Pseudaeromonas sharmana TaxID=328412 RepID=A0ABV8CR97_9GAMM
MSEDVLHAPIRRHLVMTTLTMMVGMMAMMGFGLLDTWFISLLGTTPLAAISFTFPVTFSLISLMIGMGVGTSAILGRLIGSGQLAAARRMAVVALVVASSIMLLAALVGLLLAPHLFRWMGADSATLPLILHFMQIWFFGCSLLAISMVGNAIFRAFGNIRIPSLVMVVASLVNLLLDPVLIFGWGPVPALGLTGAALASVASWLTGSGMMLWMLTCRYRLLDSSGWQAHLAADVRQLLQIALPAALTNMLTPLATVLMTTLVAGFGREAVAAYGVGGRIESIACLFILTMSMVLPPFISQNQGAGRLDRVHLGYKEAIRLVCLVQLAIACVLFVLAPLLASWFSQEASVQSVISQYLRVLPLAYAAQGVIILTNSSFNAMHQPKRALGLSLMRFFVFYVPLSWLLAQWWQLSGVFFGGVLANLLCATLAYLWFNDSVNNMEPDEL